MTELINFFVLNLTILKISSNMSVKSTQTYVQFKASFGKIFQLEVCIAYFISKFGNPNNFFLPPFGATFIIFRSIEKGIEGMSKTTA